jgi:hypothetical protein
MLCGLRMIKVLGRLLPSDSNFESPLTEFELGPGLGDTLSRELRAEPDSMAPVDDCGREIAGEIMADDLLLAFICPSTCN